ncbi:hypothetical protein P2R64_30435 [Priestia megaterium]|uniref:hypothetical protein n=1 Tax=Priestia megaterium TaxID=1404 RepID=UPI001C213143|nr:hypothetical protein [Priestia megaterium]MBU8590391.1 hypothetical protein [Priestia megaterium]MCT9853379.1 hypothetical protein [Priestia megaterium]MDF1964364.1 hypothetical protein [Priestia megaterium]
MNTTVNMLYDFGTVLRRKLLNNNLYAHYLSDAMRRENHFDFLYYFLTATVDSQTPIPEHVSAVFLKVLSDKEKLSDLTPFIMGLIGK